MNYPNYIDNTVFAIVSEILVYLLNNQGKFSLFLKFAHFNLLVYDPLIWNTKCFLIILREFFNYHNQDFFLFTLEKTWIQKYTTNKALLTLESNIVAKTERLNEKLKFHLK